jgi:hypothetical protein
MLVVERITAASEIDALHGVRERLVAADPHGSLFHSPAMHAAWLHAAPPGSAEERVWLLCLRDDQTIVGSAALVLRTTVVKGMRTRVLGFAAPRADLVTSGERGVAVAALCDWLHACRREWDLLALDDVSAHTASLIAARFARTAGYRVEGPSDAPAEALIDTALGWDEYLRLRGAHFRNRLRPQITRIERAGTLRVVRHIGYRAREAYEKLLELERSSWKYRSADSRLPARERSAFAALYALADPAIEPDLLFLDLDGKTVAGMLSLRYRHLYYLFVTCFDDSLRAWYPGRRLFYEAIRYAFEHPQIRELSFVGAYPIAQAWATGTRSYAHLRVYGPGLRARWLRAFAARPSPGQPRPEVEHA